MACVRCILQHRLQVLQIEQQQSLVIGDLEDRRQHAGLGFVQVQQAAEEQGSHLRHRGSHRMSLLAEDIPESYRAAGKGEVGQFELFHPIGDLGVLDPRLADPGKIALDVGGEDRDADAAEGLGHHLQRDRLARAGRSGNQTVTIRHGRQQVERIFALSDQHRFGHNREIS